MVCIFQPIFVPVNTLKVRNKSFIIRLLMLVSIVALSGFSIYWLRSQYIEEKKLLAESLSTEFFKANEEVMDSILFSVYIKPVIADSFNFSFTTDDHKPGNTRVIVQSSSTKTIIADSAGIVWKKGKSSADSLMVINGFSKDSLVKDGAVRLKTNDMLIRSFELIMSQSTTGNEGDSVKMLIIASPEMKENLEKIYSGRLSKLGYPFSLNWQDDSSVVSSADRIFISSDNKLLGSQVAISGISPFLLKKILPQIIFVLFLIGFTTSAFLLSYRTMKKELLLNLLRKDLISNMTHELKTPVATLKVALEALDRYDAAREPEKSAEYIQLAEKEIVRLEQLIAKLLDHVLLEEAGAGFSFTTTDLSGLVKECIALVEARVADSGASLEFMNNAERTLIRAESWYVQSAILNILDNSLKYAGPSPEIQIVLENKDSRTLVLKISDKGPGIPTEFSEKIFEKFFRVPSGDVHTTRGHGMGLSLAASVMQLHKGSIRQENLKEGGCSIILEFPSDTTDA